LKAILRYALRQQSWSPFSPEAVEFAGLNFDFHPRSVRAWLEASGFSVERQLTVSHFRVGTLKRFIPLDLLVKLDSLAQLSGDWWQLSPSVFVLAEAVGNTPVAAPGELFRCPACEYFPLQYIAESISTLQNQSPVPTVVTYGSGRMGFTTSEFNLTFEDQRLVLGNLYTFSTIQK
jgi:hypothetical protein